MSKAKVKQKPVAAPAPAEVPPPALATHTMRPRPFFDIGDVCDAEAAKIVNMTIEGETQDDLREALRAIIAKSLSEAYRHAGAFN